MPRNTERRRGFKPPPRDFECAGGGEIVFNVHPQQTKGWVLCSVCKLRREFKSVVGCRSGVIVEHQTRL